MGDGPAVLKGFVEGYIHGFAHAQTMHGNRACVRWVQTQRTGSPNSAHEEFKLSTRCHHLLSTIHPPPMPPASPGRLTITPPSPPSPLPVAGRPCPTPASPAHLTIMPPTPPSPVALTPRLSRPVASPSRHPRCLRP